VGTIRVHVSATPTPPRECHLGKDRGLFHVALPTAARKQYHPASHASLIIPPSYLEDGWELSDIGRTDAQGLLVNFSNSLGIPSAEDLTRRLSLTIKHSI